MLKFNIRHQSISRVDYFRPVEKSVKYLKARFFFLTDEWDEYEKRCLCRRDGQTYEKSIIDGECEIPWEVLLGGPFELCVVGKNGDTIVPTAAVEIDLGITLPGGPEGAEPTPSQYDELNKRIDAAVLYTEQSLSDEQRAQARANIGLVEPSWHTAKTNTIKNSILADYSALSGGAITDTIDIAGAINLDSVNHPGKYSAVGYMHGALFTIANLGDPANYYASVLKKACIEFDAIRAAGLLSGDKCYICEKSTYNNEPEFVYSIGLYSSSAYTHVFQIYEHRTQKGLYACYNTNTDERFIDAISPIRHADKTLSQPNNPADAKAVGDALALKADKFDPIEVLIAEDMLPAVHENGAILTDENGNVILRY